MKPMVESVTNFLTPYAAIGLAGSVGAVLRYVLANVSGRIFGTGFPVGTFIINMSASLLLGWFLTVVRDRTVVSETVRLAVAVGFIGTYSTFSTFAYESNSLLEDGAGIKAMANMLGSVIGGLIAVRIGIALAAR